jgi:hypothetical protein
MISDAALRGRADPAQSRRSLLRAGPISRASSRSARHISTSHIDNTRHQRHNNRSRFTRLQPTTTRDGSKQQKQKQKTTTTLGLIPEIGATARGYAAHLLSSHLRSDSSDGVSSATREQSWSSKTSWRFLKMVLNICTSNYITVT